MKSRIGWSVFPHPFVSLCIILFWLVMNQSLRPVHILLAFLLSVFGGSVYSRLTPPVPKVQNWRNFFSLFGVVLIDIFYSNLAVAKIILFPSSVKSSSGFLDIPLDLKDRNALAVLSMIITATPGTLWIKLDSEAGLLQLHVLDLDNEENWRNTIKNRYETPLREIFEWET